MKLADERIAIAYLDVQAQSAEVAALQALSRPIEAQRHLAVASGIIQSILRSGDGKSQQTAWNVISVREEYDVLGTKGLKLVQQALVRDGTRAYDRLDVVDKTGAPQTLWFEVTPFFFRLPS